LNNVCAEIKRLLIKNRHNQQLYGTETGLKLPKFPIVTRWGTWIEFVCYIAENYEKIKLFAKSISNSNNCPYDFLGLFTDSTLIEEIKLVKKYKFLPETIVALENENLSTEDQIGILKEAMNKINDEFLKDKLEKSCKKNPDLTFFLKFCSVTSPIHDQIFANVPLTTSIVEQSFSYYKNIFNDKRRSLKVESLEMLIGFSFNKFA
jgi:hypothetical protein